MKKLYESPVAEIIRYNTSDVVLVTKSSAAYDLGNANAYSLRDHLNS